MDAVREPALRSRAAASRVITTMLMRRLMGLAESAGSSGSVEAMPAIVNQMGGREAARPEAFAAAQAPAGQRLAAQTPARQALATQTAAPQALATQTAATQTPATQTRPCASARCGVLPHCDYPYPHAVFRSGAPA